MNSESPATIDPGVASMPAAGHRTFLGGAIATAAGTIASRVLGLLRDIATAALLGLGETSVMDALVVAVRIPNLFRKIFGEGALTAAYLPAFAAERERSAADGWKLASAMFLWLGGVLMLLVIVAELLLGVVWLTIGDWPRVALLLPMVAANLPYVISICIASLMAATLQAVGSFTIPALAPAMLNICWLLAAWLVAPAVATDKTTQAWVIVAAIQLAGLLQIAVQWPALRTVGFRFNLDWQATRETTRKIGRAIGAVAFGLTITQFNTLLDSLLAWGFSAKPGGPDRIIWLGGVAYPMQSGAAAAIHFGERFYQLPLGILGIAIATAIFPLLSRHAARGDGRLLGADLTLAMRVALFTSLPAGIGLMMIADPLARLVYERGAFTDDDALRTARMIVVYSSAVWAFCALPVLVRGFHALGDQRTPVRVGLLAMLINIALDVTLIWFVGEVGLAASTAAAAAIQLLILAALFHARHRSLDWRALLRTCVQSLVASLVMAAVVWGAYRLLPPAETQLGRAELLAAAMVAGGGAYLLLAKLLRMPEIGLICSGFAASRKSQQR